MAQTYKELLQQREALEQAIAAARQREISDAVAKVRELVAEFGLTYANIYNSGWTMSPIIDFYHDVQGTSPNTIPFVEGRKALAGALVFDYHNKWKVTVGYSTFFGGGNLNLMRDRDVASAAVYYSF